MTIPERTVLYYPTIDIPNDTWLRQAVTYWDNVGSIVPRRYDAHKHDINIERFSDDIQYLYEEGIFKAFDPNDLVFKDNKIVSAFEKEIVDKINSTAFKRFIDNQSDKSCNTPIYKQKLTYKLFSEFKKLNLAKDEGENSESGYYYFLFNKHTALLFISILANISDNTVIGTDKLTFANLNHMPLSKSDSEATISARMHDCLVIPSPGTSIKKILQFKRNNYSQLIDFNSQIEDFESSLRNSENRKEMDNKVKEFESRIKASVQDLEHAMRSSTITTVLGTIQTLIAPKSPILVGVAAILAGKAQSIASLPMEYLVGGTAAASAIEVALYLIKKDQEIKKELSKPFSYIYLAQRDLKAK